VTERASLAEELAQAARIVARVAAGASLAGEWGRISGDSRAALIDLTHGTLRRYGRVQAIVALLARRGRPDPLVEALLTACPGTHALRDPTRGGVAAVLVEIAGRRKLGIVIDESAIPIRDEVRGACELLGLDPLLVANEGKLLAFVPGPEASRALEVLRAHPLGSGAAVIGEVTAEHAGQVLMRTPVGGERWLELPFHEPLPRIC
jgi:thiamine monophosphate kinase